MKKIGMIAGLAWPSTLDYYRLICEGANAHFASRGVGEPHPVPPMHIESVNINYTRSLRGIEGDDGSWSGFDGFFRNTLNHLHNAGVDFAFIASNTPHTRLHSILKGVDLSVVSILDATANAAAREAMDSTLVLGTPVIMQSPAYPEALSRVGIRAAGFSRPDDVQQLQRLIDTDIHEGRYNIAREWLLEKSHDAMRATGAQSVILACTELPLVFPEHRNDAVFQHDNVCFVNTTVVHARAVLNRALESH